MCKGKRSRVLSVYSLVIVTHCHEQFRFTAPHVRPRRLDCKSHSDCRMDMRRSDTITDMVGSTGAEMVDRVNDYGEESAER